MFHYVDDPNLKLRDDGTTEVVWVDQKSQDVYFQRFDSDGTAVLETPTNVSGTPRVFSWFPDIVVDPGNSDRLYVLWQEIVFSGGSHGGEIFFARSSDGGRSFSRPLNLSNSKAGDGKGRLTEDRWDNGSLDLERAPDGSLYAVWTEYQGRLWLARSTDDGRTFGAPRLIAGGKTELPARGPSLDISRDGTLFLTWTVGNDPGADVRFQTLNSRGRAFGVPSKVHPSDHHADAPKVAVDSEGTVHLVYGNSPRGPLEEYRIQYTRKTVGDSEFERKRTLGDTGSIRFSSRNYPSLALDGSGNPYVMWEGFGTNPRHPIALEFTYSGDRGRSFESAEVIPGTRAPTGGFIGSLQGHLMERLSVNDGGGVAVAHSDFVRNEESRVRIIHGRKPPSSP